MGTGLSSAEGRRGPGIRHKLLALALLPLAAVMPVIGAVTLVWSNEALDRLLVTKIRSDLAVASGYFDRVLAEVSARIGSIAESQAMHQALQAKSDEPVIALLASERLRSGLDFINLRAPDGALRYTDQGRAGGRDPAGASQPLGEDAHAGVLLLTPIELAVLAPDLQARAEVPLLATRNAAPTQRTSEDRAMVMIATRPLLDDRGRLVGHLQGARLLNRNLPFIDRINDIVYPQGALPFGSRGTATLFLDDVRISTNVRLFAGPGDAGGERAIGTRVSQAVREAVLDGGQTWLGRAFVVNDWYVSAYEPIVDRSGRRIGMLYVGFTEQPFRWIKFAALLALGAACLVIMLGAAALSLRWARGIAAPIEAMASTMRRVGSGELGARVGPVAARDEIGQLAGDLDRLLDTIADKTSQLRALNEALDAKVIERTAQLEAAQVQLVRNEKLATMGQLTASIAHEINNPLAVIQGNLDLARDLLGPDGARVATELRIADQQVDRMRLIVAQLLQLARPGDYAGYVEQVDASRSVDESVVLVQHLLTRAGVSLRREYRATGSVAINRQELQQVLVNLLVNAAHAMPAGGELELGTHDVDPTTVAIRVTDSGTGLAPHVAANLFKPFVTSKKDGTGLGLWVSRSIVERYGGDLTAAPRSDGRTGTVFTVLLRRDLDPADPKRLTPHD